ncbi:ribonuclease P protein subunit p29 [Nannizzia gypsea CBS 118893]|uniref:Ribonuclease P protein subunit n=1 Tax=Arthroderma gypseum (strain ATCC MYA-4604 / CBS 118893) TaxID=535722 RepID=E4URM0_ARTGP|nr:ribonuclease P protein subunit p29 [Nannizzia gypsea CBS 118893]EFR00230.1 ribonuclease P protein subunit p29 [Nannizzia gypsea CBS 118893]
MAQVHMAHQLLERAHPSETAEQLFADKVKHRPLFLRPTSPTPSDNRSRRRMQRIRKKEYFLRKQKPKPLSAREKRVLGVHKLPKEEMKYDIFKGLNQLWIEYMWQVLDLAPRPDSNPIGKAAAQGVEKSSRITAASHGSKLASADFHGADIQVVRSRCVSRVGLKGIVVRDTRFAFVLITTENDVKTVPKEHTIFRFEIPRPSGPGLEARTDLEAKNLVFEIHGNQFESRAPERANKKFKWKNLDYL